MNQKSLFLLISIYLCSFILFCQLADAKWSFYIDPHDREMRMQGLPRSEVWNEGDRIHFSIKAHKMSHLAGLNSPNLKLFLEQKRFHFFRDKKYEFTDLRVEPSLIVPGHYYTYTVSATVPHVEKSGKYAVVLRRPSLKFLGMRHKTVVKSNKLRDILVMGQVRKVQVSSDRRSQQMGNMFSNMSTRQSTANSAVLQRPTASYH